MTRHHTASGSDWEARYGYTRGVRIGNHIEIAGTVAVPPAGEDVAPDAGAQMRRCGDIAHAALRELGGDLADVVRTRMYVTDARDADAIGSAHAELFGAVPPASTMIAERPSLFRPTE